MARTADRKLEYLSDDQRCRTEVTKGMNPGPCWQAAGHPASHRSKAGYARMLEQSKAAAARRIANWTPGPCNHCKVRQRRKGGFECLKCLREAKRAIYSRETVCANRGCLEIAPVGADLCPACTSAATLATNLRTGYAGNRRYRDRKAGITSEVITAAEALARQGGICGICGLDLPFDDVHLDHVMPVNRPGAESIHRLMAAAHSTCNIQKSDKPLISVLKDRLKRGLPTWSFWATFLELEVRLVAAGELDDDGDEDVAV